MSGAFCCPACRRFAVTIRYGSARCAQCGWRATLQECATTFSAYAIGRYARDLEPSEGS